VGEGAGCVVPSVLYTAYVRSLADATLKHQQKPGFCEVWKKIGNWCVQFTRQDNQDVIDTAHAQR